MEGRWAGAMVEGNDNWLVEMKAAKLDDKLAALLAEKLGEMKAG